MQAATSVGFDSGAERASADDAGGPCPPVGRDRYFHKLYALDVALPGLKKPRKQDVEKAMKGHIIEEAVLMGTYQKNP